jgi:hypothetical protein
MSNKPAIGIFVWMAFGTKLIKSRLFWVAMWAIWLVLFPWATSPNPNQGPVQIVWVIISIIILPTVFYIIQAILSNIIVKILLWLCVGFCWFWAVVFWYKGFDPIPPLFLSLIPLAFIAWKFTLIVISGGIATLALGTRWSFRKTED